MKFENVSILSHGYQGFVNFREVIGVIRNMFSKQVLLMNMVIVTTSKLTIGEMGTILNSYDLGTYRGFNLTKSNQFKDIERLVLEEYNGDCYG